MKNIFCLVGLLCLLSACHKDSNVFIPDSEVQEQFVQTSLIGRVVDEQNFPLSNIQFNVGSERITTDEMGIFQFNNAVLSEEKTLIQIEVAGFQKHYQWLSNEQDATQNLHIILKRYQRIGTFAATAGETFRLSSRAVLEIPTSAFQNFNAQQITLNASYVSANENMMSQWSGNLLAKVSDREIYLNPYALLTTNFQSSTGEDIDLADDKQITLSFPAQDILSTEVEVPLWKFDDLSGLWYKITTAQLVEEYYVAKVSSSGKYALGFEKSLTRISGSIFKNETPIPHIQVALVDKTTGLLRSTWTNSNGNFSFLTGANTDYELGIYNANCEEELAYKKDIEVLTTNQTAINLYVDHQISKVVGQVSDCQGNAVEQAGTLIIDELRYMPLGTEGKFEFYHFSCEENIQLFAFVSENVNQVGSLQIENGSSEATELILCTSSQEFLNLTMGEEELMFENVQFLGLVEESSTERGTLEASNQYVSVIFEFRGHTAGNYSVDKITYVNTTAQEEIIKNDPNLTIVLDQTVEQGAWLSGGVNGTIETNGQSYHVDASYGAYRDN